MKDNSDDPIQMRGMAKLPLSSIEDFSKLMEQQWKAKEEMHQAINTSDKKYHQVFIITVKGKSTSTHFFFVKLCGSDKVLKGH